MLRFPVPCPRFLSILSVVALALAVSSCGGGGGGSSASSGTPLTPEEEEAAKVEAELSPDNHDVPQEVVPNEYQGQALREAVLEVEGAAFGGFSAPRLSFRLLPGGEAKAGVLEKDVVRTSISGAHWTGSSAGSGTQAIFIIELSGVSDSGETFSMALMDAGVSDKVVQGNQTIYTGTIGSGVCTLGERIWMTVVPGYTKFRLVYHTSAQ